MIEKNLTNLSAKEIREKGISNIIAITEMLGAKKDGDEEGYLYWEKIYKKLIDFKGSSK